MNEKTLQSKLDEILRLTAEQREKIDHISRLQERMATRTPPQAVMIPVAKKNTLFVSVPWWKRWSTAFVTGIGLVSGILSLFPRVVVTQDEPITMADPFTARFTVANDGPLPLLFVSFSCAFNKVVNTAGSSVEGGGRITTNAPYMKAYIFKPGERATIPCPNPVLPGPFSSADIAISADYYWGLLAVRRRFVLGKEVDKAYWNPEPASR